MKFFTTSTHQTASFVVKVHQKGQGIIYCSIQHWILFPTSYRKLIENYTGFAKKKKKKGWLDLGNVGKGVTTTEARGSWFLTE